MHIQTSPAFPLCLYAYSYRLFKKFNRAPLHYSLEAHCRFPDGGYTHAALETVQNQLTFRQDNRSFTEFGGALHEVFTEGESSRCVVEGSFVDYYSSSSKLDYCEYLNQCREKINLTFDVSIETNVGEGMFFRMSSGKYQSFLKISKYFTFPEFHK